MWRIVAASILISTSLAGAQPTCQDALREAERSYAAGRVEEVPGLLAACREGDATKDEMVRAYAVLARTYVVLDEDGKAADAVAALLRLDPDFRPDRLDPAGFVRRVAEEKERTVEFQVASVSKTDEPLREAPATVVVVTAEQIERRGYSDLEELLHDLPGMDISRGNGDVYSNVYMRGYRSDRSDRMLFLVDGVEQNDLHSNTAYISRQYPLSNVKQVEVVYGPASTIYGANAFTGVISVTTKRPQELVAEGEKLGAHLQVAGGTYGTSYLDATLAGRSAGGRLSWSLTGRAYRSDERDLSGLPDWDYELAALEPGAYQDVMRFSGPAEESVDQALRFLCPGMCTFSRDGEILTIELTKEGAEAARNRDQALFDSLSQEPRSTTFEDGTDDWAVDAKLQLGNLTVGLQTWRREEGTTPWHSDLVRAGSGNLWTPRATSLYVRYSHPVGDRLQLNLFSRFKSHELDGGSGMTRFATYGGGILDVFALLDSIPAFLEEITFDQRSTQLRNELTALYEPSSRFRLIAGVELRNSFAQAELESSVEARNPDPEGNLFREQVTDTKTDQTDLGIFVQASFKLRPDLKLIVGGRLDTSSFREEEVFVVLRDPKTGERGSRFFELDSTDSVFNPRLALVHTRGPFVFKAVYAEAFKEPSNFQRFTREPGVREFFPLEPLIAERVRNGELHLNWQPGDKVAVDLVAYQADYSNAVALRQSVNPNLGVTFPAQSGSYTNAGRLRIRGVQVNASLSHGIFDFVGNYTYTDPRSLDPLDLAGQPIEELAEVRIGDIASHRFHLGAHAALGDRWGVNLRASYVGERRTGAGTTVPTSSLAAVDDYLVAHATASYRGLVRGATWQLVVRNLFDSEYYHPGVQQAGVSFAERLPQPPLTVLLRLSLTY